MKKYIIICMVSLFVMGCGSEKDAPEKEDKAPDQAVQVSVADKEQAAQKAAEATLKLIDEGKLGESWEESSTFFKKVVTKEQWIKSLGQVRAPFGKTISRKIGSAKYMTELPGAPDGEYVVIQFKTSFEKKQKAVETFTPMLDTDGKWRMTGYYIK